MTNNKNQKDPNNNNPNPMDKKPKFSAYWVYAIIILVFVGIQIFGSGGWSEPAKTTPTEFQGYLRDGDVEKVVSLIKTRRKFILLKTLKTKMFTPEIQETKLLLLQMHRLMFLSLVICKTLKTTSKRPKSNMT